MKLFNFEKHDKLKDMLKKSQQNFNFEQEKIKLSLMNHTKASHLNSDEKKRFTEIDRAKNIFVHRLAYVFASLILFVGLGSTFVFADTAKPGDKLFPLDQLQEKVLLRIPLPQETKAQIRANIVAERSAELSRMNISNKDEVKVRAVETSKESLTNAVDRVSENRDKMRQRGKHKSAEKLNEVLNRLEKLAEEQEQQTDTIREKITDTQLRGTVDTNVGEIRKARLKALQEIKRDMENLQEKEQLNSDSN